MKQRTFDNADIAVALKWDGTAAPRVSAKGHDGLARRIIEAAAAAGVTRYPDPELAPILAQLPMGDEIPEELYRAVAEVIAFAFWVSGRLPEGWPPQGAPGNQSRG
jgi:flagellar biosynthesis protein